MSNIGNQLRNLLDEEGMSQRELASKLSMSPATLNGYIQNRRQPDSKTVMRLAAYFHTTTDYLYGLTSVREPSDVYHSSQEEQLLRVYRTIPEDKRNLYLETGIVFSKYGKKNIKNKIG